MDRTGWTLAAAMVAASVVVGVERLTPFDFTPLKVFFVACVVVFAVLRVRERHR